MILNSTISSSIYPSNSIPFQVAKAYWSRYPNPNSEHVFTEDFVEVRLNEDNSLYTKRLLMKTNSLPWWGKHLFSATRVPMVEEALLYSDKR